MAFWGGAKKSELNERMSESTTEVCQTQQADDLKHQKKKKKRREEERRKGERRKKGWQKRSGWMD